MRAVSSSINEPKQRRSRALLERVTEAGLTLLEQEGLEAFTIGAVSERAGVSVGAIYRRFGSKERLLRHLHERVVVQSEERTAEVFDAGRFDGLPTAALVDAAVRALVDLAEERRPLHRAFMRASELDPEIGLRFSTYADLQRERFLALLATRSVDFAHDDPEAAVQVVYRIVYGALFPRLVFPGYDATPGMPWGDRVVDELSRVCTAYLLVPALADR